MRAYQFLNEYDRNKTATPLKKQILQQFAKDFKPSWMTTGYINADGTFNEDNVMSYIMQQIENADPTSNKIYTPWLTREYAKGNIRRLEDINARYTAWMQEHFKYKNKRDFPPQLKDIMRLNATQFINGMSNYEPPAEELKDKGEAEEVLKTSEARVLVPKNQAAACYYGQGTQWCTAATKGTNYFDRYNESGPLYIIIPTKPMYDGEKYQLHFADEQFMDEQDDPVYIGALLNNRFPSLKEYFFEVEPLLKNAIAFTDNKILEEISNIIVEWSLVYVRELVSEWESEDDYYREWQAEKAREYGYLLDKDGKPFKGDVDDLDPKEVKNMEIDWDRVYDDSSLNDYEDFNDQAASLLNGMRRSFDISAEQIRDMAMEKQEHDDEGMVTVYDMDEIIAALIEQEIGDVSGIVENIKNDFMVRNKNLSVPADKWDTIGTVGDYIVAKRKQ
jgi:hypothetical protein